MIITGGMGGNSIISQGYGDSSWVYGANVEIMEKNMFINRITKNNMLLSREHLIKLDILVAIVGELLR